MSEWQVCGLCEWSSLGAEGFLGLWEGLVPGRGERQGLAFWEGGGPDPSSPLVSTSTFTASSASP